MAAVVQMTSNPPKRMYAFILIFCSFQRWHWVEAALLTVSTVLLFANSFYLNASVWVTKLHWEWFGVSTTQHQESIKYNTE